MIVYQYDKSFDGLLTCIFEAYDRKMFPDILQEFPFLYSTKR